MSEYYIKVVDAPGLEQQIENEVIVEFSYSAINQQRIFSECAGFLLYEKGGKYHNGVGSKSIFAKGYIKEPIELIGGVACIVNGKSYPRGVWAVIEKSIIPHSNGIPLCELKKICPGPVFRKMQTVGGLFQITKSEFDALCVELDKRG